MEGTSFRALERFSCVRFQVVRGTWSNLMDVNEASESLQACAGGLTGSVFCSVCLA